MIDYPLVWHWRARPVSFVIGILGSFFLRQDRKGERCRVVARGAMNSVLVEFERDKRRVVTSRHAVRLPRLP